jgi:hypothetical protein
MGLINNNGNGSQAPAEQQPGGQAAAENAKRGHAYRCVEKCTHNGRFYRPGETLRLPEKKEVPHFELAEKAV